MTTCPGCSSSVPDEAMACPACGASLDEESTPTKYQPAPSPGDRARRSNVSRPSGAGKEARFVTGAVLAGRYRIVSLVGKGGMGEVYKAEDLTLNQVVALKFLPEALALDSAMLARFHNEVRIARQVSHSAVCRVYDIGEVANRHFISMEFIDGEDLSTLLRRIGRLPGDKAVEIARQICAGLGAAHDTGVLHRDLKPANVMIDGRGKARITDFGLAVVSEELRGDEVTAGTPAYMAPEQLTGKEVTQRSDIYSLGLIAVFRFGLLTAIVWQFVFFLSVSYPLTTDLSIWYANRSIFALAVLVALAGYGFYMSLGGQRMFQGRLLED